MNYAILNNNIITAHGSAYDLWPNTSFAPIGPNASFLAEVGAVPIRSDALHDPATEILQPCAPYLLDGEVFGTIAAPIPPPPPLPPNWTAYRDGLRDQRYVDVVAAALSSTPEAKYGAMIISSALNSFQDRGDHRDYLDCIVWILGGSTLPVAEKTELAAELLALVTRCNLPEAFINELIAELDSLSSP